MVPEVGSGATQVFDVGGEVRVGELALGGAEPREVEAQNRNPAKRQLRGDALDREQVLGAGEAVGEEGEGAHGPGRAVEPGSEKVAAASRKGDPFGCCHLATLFCRATDASAK